MECVTVNHIERRRVSLSYMMTNDFKMKNSLGIMVYMHCILYLTSFEKMIKITWETLRVNEDYTEL